jgi:hypothetical protein
MPRNSGCQCPEASDSDEFDYAEGVIKRINEPEHFATLNQIL